MQPAANANFSSYPAISAHLKLCFCGCTTNVINFESIGNHINNYLVANYAQSSIFISYTIFAKNAELALLLPAAASFWRLSKASSLF